MHLFQYRQNTSTSEFPAALWPSVVVVSIWAAVVSSYRPTCEYWKGTIASWAMLISAMMATGDFYDSFDLPLACFVLVLAAPLAMVCVERIPFCRESGVRRLLAGVAVFTGIGMAVAVLIIRASLENSAW